MSITMIWVSFIFLLSFHTPICYLVLLFGPFALSNDIEKCNGYERGINDFGGGFFLTAAALLMVLDYR